MKRIHLVMALCCMAGSALAAPEAVPPAYVLDNTEVRDIHAQTLNRDYQVFVALPDSYRTGSRRYPVLFVADANYAFPIARNIAQRLSLHAGMEEAIVVGLSYARGDAPMFSRRRDYTPTTPRRQNYRPDMAGRRPEFGQAKSCRSWPAGTGST